MASVVIISLSIVFFFLQEANGSERLDNVEQMADILNPENINNPQDIITKFDKLEESLKSYPDVLSFARNLFQSFVDELNSKYGTTLTVPEAYRLIQENLDSLQLSSEQKNLILASIELLESGSSQRLIEIRITQDSGNCERICWPWKWNWFGLNKDKKHKDKAVQYQVTNDFASQSMELPSNCYLGGVELLIAPLIALIPIPGTTALAWAVAADGTRRVIDGVVQLGEERRDNPNYIPPEFPN